MSQSHPTFYSKVVEFYDATGQPRPAIPSKIPAQRRNTLMAYIMSELMEFGDAVTLEDQADAAIDLLYFVMDVFVELGVNPTALFEFVHEANMAKVWPDGQAHIDYSVVPPRLLKPEGWHDPKLDIHDYLHDLLRTLNHIRDVEGAKNP